MLNRDIYQYLFFGLLVFLVLLSSGYGLYHLAAAGHQPALSAEGEEMKMVFVPTGEFLMGSNYYDDEKPARQIDLDAFYIDKTEVTVEEYARCVRADKCQTPGSQEENSSCNWGYSDRGNHPINCVDWSQARDFCAWAGKRLPKEAEWEKAARGTQGNTFPWGEDTPGCELAVMNATGSSGCGRLSTLPVGSKPKGASPYGIMDMAGNVLEWVADWYDEKYYQDSPARNPGEQSSGQYKVIRGGAWHDMAKEHLRASYRLKLNPESMSSGLGFRCARSAR